MEFGGIYNNGDDMFVQDLFKNTMDVISFIKKSDETEEVFQDIAKRFDLIESHIEWLQDTEESAIDKINEHRAEENFAPLTKEEWEEMCEELIGA